MSVRDYTVVTSELNIQLTQAHKNLCRDHCDNLTACNTVNVILSNIIIELYVLMTFSGS